MRTRDWLMVGVGMVGAVILAVAFLTADEAPAPPVVVPSPAQKQEASAPVRAAEVSPKPAVRSRLPNPPEAATPNATVVPLGPGDEPPEPEDPNAPPQDNDIIPEERPQTARWKLGKTEHITTLLGRDVDRLETERQEARTRGDMERVGQLDQLLKRHRLRLEELKEEARVLGEAARNEPPEPP
jgi:hypothetical protein